VLRLTGSSSALVFKPLPMDDPKQRQPDIALARQVLGWAPRMQLSEGLEKTIAYFRDRLLAQQIADLAALARSARMRPDASAEVEPDLGSGDQTAEPLAQTA
jgi:hypothetical protein